MVQFPEEELPEVHHQQNVKSSIKCGYLFCKHGEDILLYLHNGSVELNPFESNGKRRCGHYNGAADEPDRHPYRCSFGAAGNDPGLQGHEQTCKFWHISPNQSYHFCISNFM